MRLCPLSFRSPRNAASASAMNALRRLAQGRGGPAAPTGQVALVESLARRGALSPRGRCANTMLQVDRRTFVPPAYLADAYKDAPLPIGYGQTISAPHMHAIALELLKDVLQPGARVLDVGSGSGYLTACMALMVSPGGHVLGVENVPDLAIKSRGSIQSACPNLPPSSWTVRAGNVLEERLGEDGPFAAIHVGAAADELHQPLLDALAPGGRMVIPVGPRWGGQVLVTVDRDEAGQLHTARHMSVGYVPLRRPAEMEDGYLPP